MSLEGLVLIVGGKEVLSKASICHALCCMDEGGPHLRSSFQVFSAGPFAVRESFPSFRCNSITIIDEGIIISCNLSLLICTREIDSFV